MLLSYKRLLFICVTLFLIQNLRGDTENLVHSLSTAESRISATDNEAATRQLLSSSTLTPVEQLYSEDPTFEVFFDPPNGTATPTAMGIYVSANLEPARVYYDLLGNSPTLNSSYTTSDAPYITVTTPFQGGRNRTIILIGTYTDNHGTVYRSKLMTLHYFIEAAARPNSYGYFIPGIESGGYFVQVKLEESAAARPQSATSQEFANFFTNLGIGTYNTQVAAISLTDIDPDLEGFEGGFTYNMSGQVYGILIPFHNGRKFFGKVVRVNLKNGMAENATLCGEKYVIERYDQYGQVIYNSSVGTNYDSACINVLDLSSLYSEAIGFRRGFLGWPYGYLSPGQFSTIVRLDLKHFTLNSTRYVDLSQIDRTYGGYSGGFEDGTWSCFSPYRTFVGEVGGIRSNLPVDANRLTPYYNAIMVCVNETIWNAVTTSNRVQSVRKMDFSIIQPDFRGFADALRVGRYAYLCPLNSADTTFSPYLLRISLGQNGIGSTLDLINSTTSGSIRSIVTTLNLSMADTRLKGFSGLFSAGQYLFLVPYRNAYEPQNGQRGFGVAVRLDMNQFKLSGVQFIDLTTTTRNQIPSFADNQLRGFSYGFASGLYALLVPFFNADFNGKIARFRTTEALNSDLQELVLTEDSHRANVYKGFRGGFTSIWNGVA